MVSITSIERSEVGSPAGRVTGPAELTIVLPTYNECKNVPIVVELLDKALAGVAWEVIVVDDNSPDGTSQVTADIAQMDPRVRIIQRIGRRGLSGACIEGMLASSSNYVAVMDADLQHDESLLPKMLEALRSQDYDICVASRHVEGGDVGTGLSSIRAWGSNLANTLARDFLKVELSDPMSGFFMLRRDRFVELAPRLSSQGFKIMLDIVASGKGALRVKELPFVFRERQHGESKLDTLVTMDYLGLLVSKIFNDTISVRFLMYSMVGGTGVVVHLIALKILLATFGLQFGLAQLIATFVAMTSNFFLNNRLTYRDRRLRGLVWVRGLLTFYVICSFGILANVGVAELIYTSKPIWWFAGAAGALMGAVWNYVVSNALTWRKG
ncbi:Undecaprenyl-phosphate mannosyltransferase [Pseudovibrio axinellae]|uniref:Undecaprenyl-phosphate mannosyltransferase n=1 Tax=Pseudovibrio axinellae TaxID=989403 RepID=A0A165T656_9HYPH|nr:glycosyltransferase family 2 protein [Pseudovibrio axinellae]KZL05492.1 Undecaprenyl-phosphate mannosyltransferase [Pseudovibrio axinellae]SEP96948.1 dolichol-phosphate mannosyltransferase [Pseudovibrio axinellae]